MAEDLNPQREHMADESMVRNLAAQAEAIWPQEEPLVRRYALEGDARILDAGCGTGEISARLAAMLPEAHVLGVDVLDQHLELARTRCSRFGGRVRFENRSVFDLGLPAGTFDLVVCRHVIQAIPYPERVLAELARVARPGGRIHLIAEDYGMIRIEPGRLDPDLFWSVGPRAFGAATGTDLFVGRKAFGLLRGLGLEDVTLDYVVVDPLRAPRATFAAILAAWRDGYARSIATHTPFTVEEARAYFDDMIETVLDPDRYGAWFVPVLGARVPAGDGRG